MTITIYNIDNDQKDLIDLWDKLVIDKNLPPQSCYAWKSHLENIFGMKVFALIVVNKNNEVKGICLSYFTPGDEVLYSCRYGFYSENDDTADALKDEITSICKCYNLRKTHISSGSLNINLQSKTDVKDSLYLPLNYPDKEALWLSIPKKTKNMIRKAEKSGFTISYDWDHLESFYDVYSNRFIEKSLNLKPFNHFLSVKEKFGDDALFIGAFQNEKLVAGMIFITTENIVSYAYNASIVNALNNGINNLLMWEAMCIFHEKGKKYIDLSESKPDSPVFKFKSRLSKDIEQREIHYYDVLKGIDMSRAHMNWKLFLRYKAYGLLHRVMNFMPLVIKKKYLLHAGKRGRVI